MHDKQIQDRKKIEKRPQYRPHLMTCKRQVSDWLKYAGVTNQIVRKKSTKLMCRNIQDGDCKTGIRSE